MDKRNYTVKDRFLRYVQIDTQANPNSETTPSSEKQKDLSNLLSKELTELGISHEMTDNGYIYARIPSNSTKEAPKIFFCSHVDTAPDCSGTNVKPIVHSNYQGNEITLPDDPEQVISHAKFPELKDKIGHDLITASGTTLLGADDKSGVACIMDAAYQLVHNPDLKHGDVVLFFTTDEEIGRGVKHVDLQKLNADFGYTLDSGNQGCFEYENFSANGLEVNITGASAHTGYAKGKMENAIKIASAFIDKLPKDHLSPESTSGTEGFVHPYEVGGNLEHAHVKFLLRDFDTAKLTDQKNYIESLMNETMRDFPSSKFEIVEREQYRNMRDVIDNHMHIVDTALEAMKNIGVESKVGRIRGGTDGAVLSHMGLPCPNLFSGQHGIHSKLEWTSVQEMQSAVDTIIEICRLVEEKA